MELHGAPLKRTWIKLAREAYRNEPIILVEHAAVADWKVGDHVVITGTTRQFGYKDTRTVQRRRASLDGGAHDPGHQEVRRGRPGPDDARPARSSSTTAPTATIAPRSPTSPATSSSSRPTPDGIRGHTMYHRNSSGSISYAEFRHLGKEGVLGKYSLHFHLAGDTMRGSSVVGASIWDSNNRWITIHGTNYLVVRDCVGYKSVGHGFFLEDGTETRNILDRNLAVMALRGKPLPDQVLPYDKNLGSGFWWANSLNAFTNNVAAECDQDGFRFEVFAGAGFDPTLPVLQPDGTSKPVDIRTLPFLRFEKNEAHCMRFFGLNLGGFNDGGVPAYPGEKAPTSVVPAASRAVTRREKIEDVDGIGPDPRHPFLIRDYLAWDTPLGLPRRLAVGPRRGDGPLRLAIRDLAERDRPPRICEPAHGQDHLEGHLLPPPRPCQAPTRSPSSARWMTCRRRPSSPGSWRSTAPIPRGESWSAARAATITRSSRVVVNDREARPTRANFAEWEVEIDAPRREIVAFAEDQAGNVEKTPHVIPLGSLPSPRHEPDGRDAPDLARRRPRSGRPVPQGLSGTDRASEGRPDARGIRGCACAMAEKGFAHPAEDVMLGMGIPSHDRARGRYDCDAIPSARRRVGATFPVRGRSPTLLTHVLIGLILGLPSAADPPSRRRTEAETQATGDQGRPALRRHG